MSAGLEPSTNATRELPSQLVTAAHASDSSTPRSNSLPPLAGLNVSSVPTINQIPPTPVPADTLDARHQDVQLQKIQDIPESDEYIEEPASTAEWGDLIAEAETAFTQEQSDNMLAELREIGMVRFVRKYCVEEGIPPRKLLMAFGVLVDPEYTNEQELFRILKMSINRVLRKRAKLPQYNTLDDAIHLIAKSKKIMVLSGAGVSTSCGIPDFRSANGIYANLKRVRPELTDPQEMFDIHVFKQDPLLFYSFAKELYPSNFKPSPSHKFVKLLEDRHVLLRNYTQNIDTLEHLAGVRKVLNCHGSFAEALCIVCGHRVPGDVIKEDLFNGTVPLCQLCTKSDAYILQKAMRTQKEARLAKRQKFSSDWDDADDDDDEDEWAQWEGQPIMKPSITFFGEKLSDDFDNCLLQDRDEVDLLIVMGTSLKVAPVSEILGHIPHSVPQILINRDPVTHCQFDVVLLGDSDAVVQHLCRKMGELQDDPTWQLPSLEPPAEEPERVGNSHVYLFPGANRTHKWVQLMDPNRSRSSSKERSAYGGIFPPGLQRRNSRGSRPSSRASSPGATSDTGSVSSLNADRVPRGRPRKRSFGELDM